MNKKTEEMDKQREEIKLNPFQHMWIVNEHYLTSGVGMPENCKHERDVDWDNVEEEYFPFVEKHHAGGTRRSEIWRVILERKSDGKFFETHYEDSQNDMTEWMDINEYRDHTLREVFPKKVEVTVYE